VWARKKKKLKKKMIPVGSGTETREHGENEKSNQGIGTIGYYKRRREKKKEKKPSGGKRGIVQKL